MNIEDVLNKGVKEAISARYTAEVSGNQIQFQETRKEFTGDITIVMFPLLKISKKSPELTGQDIGNYLKTHYTDVEDFTVIKGFLNIVISRSYWLSFLSEAIHHKNFGKAKPGPQSRKVMVEYSS